MAAYKINGTSYSLPTLYSKGGFSCVGSINQNFGAPDEISKNLSGVILEQTKKSAIATSKTQLTQEFYLPADYTRVDKTPSLTGLQIYLNPNQDDTTLNYEIHRYDDNYNYRSISGIPVTSITLNNGTATVTTALKHYLTKNDIVRFDGFVSHQWNDAWNVNTVINNTQFTINVGASLSLPSTYGAITGGGIFPDIYSYNGNDYNYTDNAFIHSVIIKNKINKNKKIYGEYTLRVTGLTKRVQKNDLILINKIFNKIIKYFVPKFWNEYLTTHESDLYFNEKHCGALIQSVKLKKSYTEIVIHGPRYRELKNGYLKKDIGNGRITNSSAASGAPEKYSGGIEAYLFNKFDTQLTRYRFEQNFKELSLPVDENYDSQRGWTSLYEKQNGRIINKGQITIAKSGAQWINILFPSIEIDDDWVDQKYRVVLRSNKTIDYPYVTPGITNQKIYNSNYQGLTSDSSSLVMRVLASTGDEGEDVLSNQFRSIATKLNANNILNSETNFWSSKPNPSKYGVESLYFDVSSSSNDPIVIDSVYLDAITPGVQFNIYYSNDDSFGPKTTPDDWDKLLWARVPRVYRAYKRQSFALPSPITAKYIKIEFTSLQAEYYSPGPYDLPILYKKYPSWVLNYFLAIHALDYHYDKTEDPIVTSQTNLQYDLYNLAFVYYKGDIISPINQTIKPIVIEDSNNQNNIITNLLKSDNIDNYDDTSLANINASLDQFRKHPGYQSRGSVIDRVATIKSINEFFNYSIEQMNRAIADTVAVSQTDRNHLLIEKSMPEMYFYPTSRHRYRVAYAKIENEKAYFVKIREIRFERNNFNVINDSPMYKFVPGDQNNFDRCDFIQSTDKWSIT